MDSDPGGNNGALEGPSSTPHCAWWREVALALAGSMPLERTSIPPAGGRAQPEACIPSLEKVGRAPMGLQTGRVLVGLYSHG